MDFNQSSKYRYKLFQCFILTTIALFISEKSSIAQSQSPVWQPASTENSPPQFQPQQAPNDPELNRNLTAEELEQTIRALELIEVLGFTSLNVNEVSSIRQELQQLSTEQSPPYQLSPQQNQQLINLFAALTESELTAINQILITQNSQVSIALNPEEIKNLREVLSSIPQENLSNLQQEQLAVIQDFFSQIPQNETVSLSPEQTEALGSAIEFVFFTPEAQSTATAELPEFERSEQVTLTPLELEQTIRGLQAIQQGNLRPNQEEEITQLLNQLQNQQETQTDVTLSPQQTQQLRNLIGSLTPNETAAIEILLLSDRAPETLDLTQQEIDDLLTFFQELPTENFTATQRQQRTELINFLSQIREQEATEIRLSSAQTQAFLQGIQILLFDQGAIASATVPLEQLQNIITYIETAQKEISLSSSQAQNIAELRQKLANLEPNANNQFVIPPEQNQQLRTFINSLNRRQRQDIQRELIVQAGGSVSSPSISVLNPIGYGNSWGNIGVGLSYQERTRFGDSEDGSLSFSMGFGDPQRSVGFDTTVTILSLTDDNQSAAFSTGSMSFKLSRNLSNNTAVSLGVENLIRWPEGSGDSGTSTYLVGSKLFQLRDEPFSPFGIAYLTAGVGNGRFRPPEDFDFEDDGFQFNPFASLAVQVLPRVNAMTEWTGQDISVGLSIVPFREIPLVITLAGIDLQGNAEEAFGREGKARFTGAVSYGFFF